MMKSEFIELTGFEPTADEYRQIEDEYMACDIDKKDFCKQWIKNGGIQRLCRLRAARIEELERELESVNKWANEMVETADKRIALKDKRIEDLTAEKDGIWKQYMDSEKKLTDMSNRMKDFRYAIKRMMEE